MNVLDISGYLNKCSACGACISVCPLKAIEFAADNEGFLYPSVDKRRCIDCGQCVDVCNINKCNSNISVLDIKIAYSLSEATRIESSSGGIFALLSNEILKSNGIVYGVAFNGMAHAAFYTDTNTIRLERLMKSKYVEAIDNNSFEKVKCQLDSGMTVLYSGTPCKIMGLKNFLKRDYDNLITVDFKCHGKPSGYLLREVIKQEEMISGQRCIDVSFREKPKGWRKQVIIFYFEDGTRKIYDSSHYYYYYYFLHNYSLRRSCFGCECYRSHMSDITLADHWSVNKEFDDDKGISTIYINSKKGEKLIEKIQEKIMVVDDKGSVFSNDVYAHSFGKGYELKKRNQFYDSLNKYGVEYMKDRGYQKILKYDDKMNKLKNILVKLKHKIK